MRLRICIIALSLFLLAAAGCSNKAINNAASPQQARTGNPLAGKQIPAFQAVDLQGQPVTEGIFQNHPLTMLNLWGTFCSPCVKEMPDIEKLQNRYRDRNILVMGVVVDKDLTAARRIASAQKATYISIIPDSSLESSVVSAFSYVPTTIFVDSTGRILAPLISGSNSMEGYSAVIDGILKDMEPAGGRS